MIINTLLILGLITIFAPLIGSVTVGCLQQYLSKSVAHWVAILGVAIATISACYIFYLVCYCGQIYDSNLYSWISSANNAPYLSIGLLLDSLSVLMLVIVCCISLVVHIYSIGYMRHEAGYHRFFSYISLFTFMMIVLVSANNFVQLFFGWEGVGLVSYLLIGFYYTKNSAVTANFKAFIVNRVGDLGFLLGIGLILAYCGTLNYAEVFDTINNLIDVTVPHTEWNIITAICCFLFVGAMGKSAQFPLHIWLPDSMEGPTPISALIHAATMVTAGIFMVARLSPLYNLSADTLAIIAIIGAINALFLGMIALVQFDIKRVIAYSTLSQLGYMVAALGCGAYTLGIFHLMTHAFFKALLFLTAGAVINSLHHEQDMRNMGGLWNKTPILYILFIIGNCALIGLPPFSGFFSKDLILEAATNSAAQHIFGSNFVLFSLYASIVITAAYSTRQLLMVFHGKLQHSPSRTQLNMLIPLCLLAIPSIIIGYVGISHVDILLQNSVYNSNMFNDFKNKELFNPHSMMIHLLQHLPIYLAAAGALAAYILHLLPNIRPANFIPSLIKFIQNGYCVEFLLTTVVVRYFMRLADILWKIGDIKIIDGWLVNGSAKIVVIAARVAGKLQSGYINNYAAMMFSGFLLMIIICNALGVY